MNRPVNSILSGVRLALVAGFGGLLLLLVLLGYYAGNVLRQIDSADTESTHTFVRRDDALEAIRQNAYKASSHIRNFLMDPTPAEAVAHRELASSMWARMERSLLAYQAISAPEAQPILTKAQLELARYWSLASDAMQWNEERRRRAGYDLLADQLGPLRDQFLATLDAVRVFDQQQHRQTIMRSSGMIDWLRNRLHIAVGVTLLLGFALAGISFIYLLRLENTARLRYQALLDAHLQLEQLSQRILDVQEAERRNLARELHDEVGQSLGALLVDLGHVQTACRSRAPEAAQQLDSGKRIVERTLAAIRNLCLLLRPSMLDDLGLIPALHWQARETARRMGIQIGVTADDPELELPDAHKTAVYRVLQEALQNISRHSGAAHVEISVRQEGHRLIVVVKDDGKGFNPRTTRGLGLLGMEERVAHLNGRLHIDSAPGRGTMLRIELPLEQPVPAFAANPS